MQILEPTGHNDVQVFWVLFYPSHTNGQRDAFLAHQFLRLLASDPLFRKKPIKKFSICFMVSIVLGLVWRSCTCQQSDIRANLMNTS